jgi:hypothetical protein
MGSKIGVIDRVNTMSTVMVMVMGARYGEKSHVSVDKAR